MTQDARELLARALQRAEEIKDTVSVGTRIEINRLLTGVERGHVTTWEALAALSWMRENGGAGRIAFAEDALTRTGADIDRITQEARKWAASGGRGSGTRGVRRSGRRGRANGGRRPQSKHV